MTDSEGLGELRGTVNAMRSELAISRQEHREDLAGLDARLDHGFSRMTQALEKHADDDRVQFKRLDAVLATEAGSRLGRASIVRLAIAVASDVRALVGAVIAFAAFALGFGKHP